MRSQNKVAVLHLAKGGVLERGLSSGGLILGDTGSVEV